MENLPRPAPERSVFARAREWVEWFGPGRLVGSAIAVVVVCGGAFWLLRAPSPPTEASLPSPTATEVPVTLAPPATTGVPTADSVVVHVTGAVARPGVYELEPGSRVQLAVDLAGGATEDGDPDAINLAAVVVDGARVYVPVVGEVVPVADVGSPDVAAAGPVDVNRATAAELESLPGVGPATATAIVAERERNGPFVGVEDLERVPGIGPAKLASLRDLVTT